MRLTIEPIERDGQFTGLLVPRYGLRMSRDEAETLVQSIQAALLLGETEAEGTLKGTPEAPGDANGVQQGGNRQAAEGTLTGAAVGRMGTVIRARPAGPTPEQTGSGV